MDPKRTVRARTWLATGAVAIGVGLGAAGIAGAATGGSSTTATTPAATAAAPAQGSQQAPPQGGQAPADPSTLKNGPGETLLTGDTASKVEDAAKAAVPGGTIIRVETDNEGSAYEAHVKKSDGSIVTIKLDKSFKVTATEQGFGGGPGGHRPPQGAQTPQGAQPPAGSGSGTTQSG